jgi:lipopolysaccharide cholinephosphotransferase
MRLTIKEIQEIETDMTKEFAEICDRNEITYFLAYGSVLGAIRHQNQIPWDPDSDVLVPNNQFEKLIKTLRRELSDKYFLDYHDINNNYTATFPRIGLKGYSTMTLHVDVFRLIGVPDNTQKQIEFINRLKKLCLIHFHKQISTAYRGKMTNIRKLKNLINKIINIPYSLEKVRKEFDQLCSLYSYDNSVFVTNPTWVYGSKDILEKKIYGKGLKVKYSEIDVMVPVNHQEYLTHYYGDYMELPPKEEREIKDFYEIKELILE